MSLSLIMNWLVKFMNCCTVGLLSTAVFVVQHVHCSSFWWVLYCFLRIEIVQLLLGYCGPCLECWYSRSRMIIYVVSYYVSAHSGSLLYYIVFVGFLWNWLSFWLVIISEVFCQVWQYYSRQFIIMAIHLLKFIRWLAEFIYAPLDGWLLYWFDWCWSDLGAVEGCVTGVALLPSVAPCMVEQPRSRAPRCYLLRFPGSMISTTISETLSLVFMFLFFDPLSWVAKCWYCCHI